MNLLARKLLSILGIQRIGQFDVKTLSFLVDRRVDNLISTHNVEMIAIKFGDEFCMSVGETKLRLSRRHFPKINL